MVLRILPDRGLCRPKRVVSNDDVDSSRNDSDRVRCPSVTRDAIRTESRRILQDLGNHHNAQVSEVIYRLNSGEIFLVNESHPEPQQLHLEGSLIGLLSRSHQSPSKDSNHADIDSESGRARSLPRAGRHSRSLRRMRRGGSSPAPALRPKRRRARSRPAANESENDFEDKDEEIEGAETEMQQIRYDEIHLWYEKVFRSLKQVCCKDILRAWIRHAHPNKQTHNPYNGGKHKANIKRSMRWFEYEGHYSKPDYWLDDRGWKNGHGVRHKEPDHLDKFERVKLLIHLLRCQFKVFKHANFSLETLRQSIEGIMKGRPHWKRGYLAMLEEVYSVREREMRYERGEIDGDALISVRMPECRVTTRKASKSAIRAARPSLKQRKKKSANMGSMRCIAPVANMYINAQTDSPDTIASHESPESTTFTNPSSSTGEVASDASWPDARTTQPGLPLSDSSSWPTETRGQTIQEDWTLQTPNPGQAPTLYPFPAPSSNGVTPPNEGQRPRQFHFAPSLMPTFPGQALDRQNDHLSMQQPTRTFSQPNYSAYAASSSGFAGYTPLDYTMTPPSENSPAEPSMFTPGTDFSLSHSPYTNASFGNSDDCDAQLGQWNNINNNNTNLFHTQQPYLSTLDQEAGHRFGLQAETQHSGLNSLFGGMTDSTAPPRSAFLPERFRTDAPPPPRPPLPGAEHGYGIFSNPQGHGRF